MKVLHLPTNVASQISATIRGLRDIGIDARGIVNGNASIQDPIGLEMLPKVLPRRRHPIRGTLQLREMRRAVLDAIRWADVVHWYCSWALPNAYDVQYAAQLGKVGIVEFWGTDIRIPRISSADNPYMAKMFREYPKLDNGAEGRSTKRQRTFASHGMSCLIPGPDLLGYVDSESFSSPYRTRQRITMDDYPVTYPDSSNRRPLVMHLPSHKVRKGTDAVLRAVEEAQRTHAFDFELIHGICRSEALQNLRSCDIFLDQFVAGAHGLGALEAMAFGKPTLCYIKPSLLPKYPPELPIVVADQENLTEVLKTLLESGQRRHEIGRQSRAYVEQHHDSRQLAKGLVDIYEKLLGRRDSRQ